MLMNVDVLTTYDPQKGHRSSYVLSTADESSGRQTIMLPDGIGAVSMIMLRLISTEQSELLSVVMTRSTEQIGVPQRLGTLEIDDDDFASLNQLQ
jgi:hypothetical protein